jgi:AcrR family transcriptional regulator
MAKRLSRSEQVERNRAGVLAAARRVFLARGYLGASLENIAEEAGFSKGVVYSQFESKADLFLALLEQRIAERAAQNDRVARTVVGEQSVAALLRHAEQTSAREPAWSLLLIEFRAHAARDPELNQRYARLHVRTVERFAEALDRAHERAGIERLLPARHMAELILAIDSGVALERAVNRDALPTATVARALAYAAGSSNGRRAARSQAAGTAQRKRRA